MGVLKEPEVVEHSIPKIIQSGWINSYDFDGVITVGIIPREVDIVITGRGIDELAIVKETSRSLGVRCGEFYLNPKTKAMGRTREDSGKHKAATILKLISRGVQIWNHFDDDPVQIKVIDNEIEDRLEALKKIEKPDSNQIRELSILEEFHIVPVLTYRQIK